MVDRLRPFTTHLLPLTYYMKPCRQGFGNGPGCEFMDLQVIPQAQDMVVPTDSRIGFDLLIARETDGQRDLGRAERPA